MNTLFHKIQTAYKSGELSQKILYSFLRHLKIIQQNSFRIRSSSLTCKCKKLVSIHFNKKEKINQRIHNLFYEYSDIKKNHPQHNKIIDTADDILKHKFDILGSGRIQMGKIDWHTDFKSGFKWSPGKFYKNYLQVDLNNNSDVKIPRELSRCHHFTTIGQAYLLTGNEKYTEEFIFQINSWINENPLMRSINWGCTMDVSIRSVNWIWALTMFKNSNLLTKENLLKIVASLYEHGHYIFLNPEKMPQNNNNHYLASLGGQIYLGLFLKGLPETEKWLDVGIKELYREMRNQILPSGPSYERSINYHRLVLEIFLSTILLVKRAGMNIPQDIWFRLEKMIQFVLYYSKPDGSVPVIGDMDDGRFHIFSINQNIDHRYLLAVGAICFKRADFKFFSNGYNQDCFFLLGGNSKKAFEKIPAVENESLNSKSFPDAGFYIMRKNNNFMFINNSGKSHYYELPCGTHTHSDLLSFELSIDGKNILIDPGSYTYSSDQYLRKQFRSTRMHNTVAVDKQDQNLLSGKNLWNFNTDAVPTVNQWESNDDFDLFDGNHTGYNRLKDPVIHRRTIHFDKKNITWTIDDYLYGNDTHLMEWFFHFDADIDFLLETNSIRTNNLNDFAVKILFQTDKKITLSKEKSWISKSYGTKIESIVLRAFMEIKCSAHLKTIISKI